MTKRYTVFNRVKELLAIKERDERRKISQRTLADETGLDRRTISLWLRNAEEARYDHVLGAFCDYFGVSIGELLYIETDEEEGEIAPDIKTPLAIPA